MSKTASRRAGFTLIEVLVALAIIALLVAAVFPTLTRQIEDAEPTRLANDLASIRAGLETFTVNVREVPSDLEDLANVIGTSDQLIDGTTYLDKHVNRWKGPYIDATLAVVNGHVTGTAITSGFSAAVQNDLATCNSTAAEDCDTNATANFAALKLTNLTTSEWSTINDLIDGENETATATGGKWRATLSGSDVTTAFYYAVPIAN